MDKIVRREKRRAAQEAARQERDKPQKRDRIIVSTSH